MAPAPTLAAKSVAKLQKQETPIIRISTPASQRRRLRRTTGLRSGRDRILEIDDPHADNNDMVDQGEDVVVRDDDPGAWTDDDEAGSENGDGAALGDGKRSKKLMWAERAAPLSPTHLHDHLKAVAPEEAKLFERIDRRKRRRALGLAAHPSAPTDSSGQHTSDSHYHPS